MGESLAVSAFETLFVVKNIVICMTVMANSAIYA